MDKRKLSRKAETSGGAPVVGGSGNSSAVSLETLHQLAASYFIDRESTLRRLHHIQIATGAIKVKGKPNPQLAPGQSDHTEQRKTVSFWWHFNWPYKRLHHPSSEGTSNLQTDLLLSKIGMTAS